MSPEREKIRTTLTVNDDREMTKILSCVLKAVGHYVVSKTLGIEAVGLTRK